MSYRVHLEKLKTLPQTEKDRLISEFIADSPFDKEDWPITMPASVAPKLVIIGVSPGGSPNPDVNQADYTHPPSIQKPRKTHFFYPDGSGYWDNIRDLSYSYFNEFDNLDLMEALSLTSHFNLSLERAGNSEEIELDKDIVQWVYRLLNENYKPDLVVLLGLKKKIREIKNYQYWNHKKGLRVNWENSPNTISFNGKNKGLTFEEWNVFNNKNHAVKIVLWPNHPTQIPFRNSPMIWKESVEQYLVHF